MSKVFFDQLKMTLPHHMLSIGSSSHGKQTGRMLEKIEDILILEKPDAVLVYGDTNSTLSGALAASKLLIPLIHIEAGLRSRNKNMPEEINRIVTDHVSDYLFVSSQISFDNLLEEGISSSKIFNVGDIMFDSILLSQEIMGQTHMAENHILVTLHRPYNTDDPMRLKKILMVLNSLDTQIIFPVHPRTKHVMQENKLEHKYFENIRFIEPVSYFDLIKLQQESKCVITDSGGIQKEAYWLKKKCITLRSETEWLETLVNNWNTLVFDDLSKINVLANSDTGEYIEGVYGNGDTGKKIANILSAKLRFN